MTMHDILAFKTNQDALDNDTSAREEQKARLVVQFFWRDKLGRRVANNAGSKFTTSLRMTSTSGFEMIARKIHHLHVADI